MLLSHCAQPLTVALIRRRCDTFLHPHVSLHLWPYSQGRQACLVHYYSTGRQPDQRSRLSRLWLPSGGITTSADEDAHSKLVRAGFLRQAHSGIFHMLPLGYRVQEKIERLIDKHMKNLGASRLDLSSISSEDLWRKSGRFSKANSELFLFKDRKNAGYLLSPTHEEEITDLVASVTRSHKQLPVRLYQISRKYRDELRPRHGLLRSREFIMKDLYTFDNSKSVALATYEQVRKAYAALFNELRIPYLVAEADSGNMGGNLSHEFHFLTPKGEDRVLSCRSCDYVANEELAKTAAPVTTGSPYQGVHWTFRDPQMSTISDTSSVNREFSVWRGLSRDRTTLVNVWYALSQQSSHARPEINIHAVKRVVPDLDASVENAEDLWTQNVVGLNPKSPGEQSTALPRILNLIDCRLPMTTLDDLNSVDSKLPIYPKLDDWTLVNTPSFTVSKDPSSNEPLDLLRVQEGDLCPKCGKDQLNVYIAIELGHTFFLGTRYSEPFEATITLPSGQQALMQMGCHGIGVSRMIGAVAETLADEKGLNWPRVIAPYEAVVVPTPGCETDAATIYDTLTNEPSQNMLDVVLDDRSNPFAWKMKDADLIGYPIIVVVGKNWKTEKLCEVQCRRLGVRKNVHFELLSTFVQDLLVKL